MNNETAVNKTVIMYQAFGIPEAFSQVTFSLLTLYHLQKGDFNKIHPVVYTDNATHFQKYFSGLPFSFIQVSKEVMTAYKGPHNYFHRMRYFFMKECFAQFKSNIIYVDGDTFFLKSPEGLATQIDSNNSLMHVREFSLEEGGNFEGKNWLELRKLVRDNTFTRRGENFKIPYSNVMWNSGVVGIAYENRHLVEDASNLIDQILPVSKIFTAEQFAIGYVLQNKTQIKPAEAYVFHYWPEDLKLAYNHFIKDFFALNSNLGLPELASRAYEASRQKELIPRIEPTFFDKLKLRLSLIRKVVLKGSL